MTRSVLLIDDDVAVLGTLEKAFRRAGYTVAAASTGEVGVDTYLRDATDLVILDLNLPDLSGMDVLARLRREDPDAAVIVLTGQADVATAVEAMRAGAENFLPKPIDIGHLYAAAERGYEKIQLRRRTRYLESREVDEPVHAAAARSGGLMEAIEERVELVAPQNVTVLITGETGTGKSWLARRIHALSPRRSGPFVEVNAAGLTPTFLASELFGHEKGAFTDARTLKRGLFEVADGGTLFLDEIGDLAAEVQPKLLHVIETRRFRRVGGTRDIESDVRLVAATNRDLKKAVATGGFREDLYYRLAVLPLALPPLRERGAEQVAALAATLLGQLQTRAGTSRTRISPQAMRLITRYPWPGNIRELRNVLERSLILSAGAEQIQPWHLPPEIADEAANGTWSRPEGELELTLAELERRHIERVLAHCEGNRTVAARMLGISRVGLYKKLRRLGEAATA